MSPQISLVICTYNRCRYLPETLASLTKQTLLPALYEIIIVDNASTDDTAGICKTFIQQHAHMPVRYCYEAKKGLSAARNRGMNEALSLIVNYVDDDVILPADYLRQMLEFFIQHPQAQGAGGKVIPKYESGTEPVWMNKYLNGFVGKVDYGDAIRKFEKPMKYPVGCNMAYKKNMLLQAGGFNEALQFRSDDKYIFQQVHKYSSEIFYVPAACLQHYIDKHRLELSNFKTLFLKTGNEEKKRVKAEQGIPGVFRKGIEFSVKTIAAGGLYFIFLLNGQPAKGKYVWLSQYCTLKGFFKKAVFVR